jgi:hypothetical protein
MRFPLQHDPGRNGRLRALAIQGGGDAVRGEVHFQRLPEAASHCENLMEIALGFRSQKPFASRSTVLHRSDDRLQLGHAMDLRPLIERVEQQADGECESSEIAH